MRAAVVALVDLAIEQPVVRAKIHDLLPGGQGGCELPGRAVREGKEHQVGAGQRFGGRLAEDQIGDRTQLRMHLAHPLARVPVCGHGDHVEIGMRRDQPKQFGAGVPARTRDRDPKTHAQDYALGRNFIQSWVTVMR